MNTYLQLLSTISADETLTLSLGEVSFPTPQPDEVIVRVLASPINPSDLGLLFGAADMTTAKGSGSADAPVITASVPHKLMAGMAGRLDQAMPVGNEGAGTVIEAGADAESQAIVGKTVALLGGAMYAQVRCIKANQCLLLPEGTTAEQGASCFVNPLTALGMVATMRLENHSALVHTAAASNLGQMLNKICLADGIDLINVVRKPEQAKLLKDLGAKYVVNSSEASFRADLTEALKETKATIAFDATGGGKLAGQILACMEVAANSNADTYSRYGSTVHKQVYIYGGLDRSATELTRNFGMAWSIGGWLLPPFLAKIGLEAAGKLRARVAAEITTTFASHYTKTISLQEALSLGEIAVYGKQATGQKYLVNPNKA